MVNKNKNKNLEKEEGRGAIERENDKESIVATTHKDGNRASSRWVAPIPTPAHLFETILIPLPFKKLNGTGRGIINLTFFLILIFLKENYF